MCIDLLGGCCCECLYQPIGLCVSSVDCQSAIKCDQVTVTRSLFVRDYVRPSATEGQTNKQHPSYNILSPSCTPRPYSHTSGCASDWEYHKHVCCDMLLLVCTRTTGFISSECEHTSQKFFWCSVIVLALLSNSYGICSRTLTAKQFIIANCIYDCENKRLTTGKWSLSYHLHAERLPAEHHLTSQTNDYIRLITLEQSSMTSASVHDKTCILIASAISYKIRKLLVGRIGVYTLINWLSEQFFCSLFLSRFT